jgi:hypothetical protein
MAFLLDDTRGGGTVPPPLTGGIFQGFIMTAQIQHVIRRLSVHHGYSAQFVETLADGIYLYSVGGIMYRIRGDGTIL